MTSISGSAEIPSFVTSATYVRGSHTYKAGLEVRQMKYPTC